VKTERLLFRGQRPLRSLDDVNVVVVDGQLVSPWKALAAAAAAQQLGALKVFVAAAACTQAVQERIRARKYDLVCPTVVLEPEGHPRPFGDPVDANSARLRSIVLARQAA
jgi:predicted phosphoribosyltransferase